MSADYVKNITVIGGTGNLGSLVLQNLVSTGKFSLTVITRPGSESKIPLNASVHVVVGDTSDHKFLVSALKGAEALIIVLGFRAMNASTVIDAAAVAGVKYILPTEYGSDNSNPKVVAAVQILQEKAKLRAQIDELAKTHNGLCWIGVVTNPWLDLLMKTNGMDIDWKTKVATLYDGTGQFNLSTIPQAARGIAKIFELPKTSTDSSPSLAQYENGWFFISSFYVTQREIFDSVQRATNTTDADWTINHRDVDEYLQDGHAKIAQGDFSGLANLIMGNVYKTDAGGDYQKKISSSVLGLFPEDLDTVVRAAVSQPILSFNF